VTLRPRENGTIAIADVSHLLPPEGEEVVFKIAFPASHAIDFIGLDTSRQVPLEIKPLRLLYATHSKHGDVTAVLSGSDNIHAELKPGEHIDLAFEAANPEPGMVRDFIFISEGRYHTVGAEPEDEPDRIAIVNYPNPFNPTTTIEFTLPEASQWQLTIYNVLGREVAAFDGHNDAGRVALAWDASDQASGIYLYRLEAGSHTASRKMLLLK
jgi:hypothetical protein